MHRAFSRGIQCYCSPASNVGLCCPNTNRLYGKGAQREQRKKTFYSLSFYPLNHNNPKYHCVTLRVDSTVISCFPLRKCLLNELANKCT